MSPFSPNAPLKQGLYLHVPFCASTCEFCSFYQEKPRKAQIEAYLDGIEAELALYTQEGSLAIDTVFFGGGTPGVLTAQQLERLGTNLLACLKHPPQEWTVEMAPSTVKQDKLAVLKALGVTRISMGVQSFKRQFLEALGRLHTPKQVEDAYAMLKAANFKSLNLDLMFALPGQTLADSLEDLEAAAALEPKHISTYCLTYEEDTALYLKLTKGQIRRDEAQELALYEQTWDFLERKGYTQYEISNFSKPGHECLHNKHTWAMHDWLGLGPSAASQWKGKRWTQEASLSRWLEGLKATSPERPEWEHLDDTILAIDACIFGLRMENGIDLAALQRRFPLGPWKKLEAVWEELEIEELLETVKTPMQTILRLTRRGRLLADGVGLRIYEA